MSNKLEVGISHYKTYSINLMAKGVGEWAKRAKLAKQPNW